MSNQVCFAVAMEVDEMETRMPQVQESRERVENRRKTQSDGERDDDGEHFIVLNEK